MRRDRLIIAATLTAIFSADLYFVLIPKLRTLAQGSGGFCSCPAQLSNASFFPGLAVPYLSNWTSNATPLGESTGGGKKEEEEEDAEGSKLQRLFAHPLYNIQTPALEAEERLLEVEQLMEYYRKKVSRWERHMKIYSEAAAIVNLSVATPEATFDPDASWVKFHLGINRYALYSRDDPSVQQLLTDMRSMKVINADYTQDEKALKGACDCTQVVKPSGHHLKLALKMSNFAKVMFKPMRQQRHEETPEDFFYFVDFQRHNAEIAAFHLDRCRL